MAPQVILAIVVTISAALVTSSAHVSSLAALDISQVMSGEYWRLFSGHLTHLTWVQYTMDAPAFFLLYATYSKRETTLPTIFLLLIAALSVSLSVVYTGAHQVYGGLSGLSCAAASALLLKIAMEQPRHPFAYILFILFGAYLLSINEYASGVRVAHEAHITGAVSGIIFTAVREKVRQVMKKEVEDTAPRSAAEYL